MTDVVDSGLLREMTAADVAEVLAVQEPGAVIGLADVFPQDLYPFPRAALELGWQSTGDTSRSTYPPYAELMRYEVLLRTAGITTDWTAGTSVSGLV